VAVRQRGVDEAPRHPLQRGPSGSTARSAPSAWRGSENVFLKSASWGLRDVALRVTAMAALRGPAEGPRHGQAQRISGARSKSTATCSAARGMVSEVSARRSRDVEPAVGSRGSAEVQFVAGDVRGRDADLGTSWRAVTADCVRDLHGLDAALMQVAEPIRPASSRSTMRDDGLLV
jgi:hypothetical protein